MEFKKIVYITSMIILVISSALQARDFLTNVKNSSHFDSLLRTSDFSVVLLYSDSKSSRDLLRMFRDASKVGDYRDARVQFIMVDTQKRDLSQISSRYKISATPAVFLFRGNRPVETVKTSSSSSVSQRAPASIAVLTGNFTLYDIRTMIDSLLPGIHTRAAAIRKARIERAQASAYYGSWGVGFGYPYWGYGPGWGGWWW